MSDKSTEIRKVRKARKVRKVTKATDFIKNVKNGNSGLSEKDLKQTGDRVRSNQERTEKKVGPISTSNYIFDEVLLAYMVPSSENARKIKILNEPEFKSGFKGVYFDQNEYKINCSKDDDDYNSILDEVEDILRLAENLKIIDLIQPITVWQRSSSAFPIITGHRRFCALVYNFGYKTSIKSKVYIGEPQNIFVLRWVENHERVDLPLKEEFNDFLNAYNDLLSTITDSTEMYKMLSLGKTAFFAFKKWAVYEESVGKLLEIQGIRKGIITDIIKLIEKEDKTITDLIFNRVVGNINAENVLNYKEITFEAIKSIKNSMINEVVKEVKKGRTPLHFAIPKISINSPQTLENLIKKDLTTIECGVDWENIDFSDYSAVKDALQKVIKFI